ncbi:sensor domain-containing diguanylate cyclase [Candidatus Odyssella thessalonicensis]|uniref:sensor domain-containing diguanylate cyclase n=1 Tax=Candidatus Odyssella thessalonicensis TaxID=84647 RepID=UPI000A04BEC7|nr:diguanylate cyclase [Candidatus Odyssella thessalonicensis]
MQTIRAKNMYLIIGLLLLLIGSIVGTGWIISSKLLITFFVYRNPLGFIALLSLLFSGLFFTLKSLPYRRFTYRLKQAAAASVILVSTVICILILFNFSVYAYLFPTGEFATYFRNSMNIYPHLLWLIAGFLLLQSTHPITNRKLSYLETTNFILLFFAILGIILSFHEFSLIYTWLNQFSMPLPYGIALTLVNIGMIIAWGDNRDSNKKESGEEDREIRFFTISMLSQAIMSAVFLGAMLLAAQNESFLKASLERYASLEAAVLKNDIENEVSEIQGLLKALNSNLEQQKVPKIDKRILDELDFLSKSQDFNAVEIKEPNGNKRFSEGSFITNTIQRLKVIAAVRTHLVYDKRWYIEFEIPLLSQGKLLGTIRFQKPLKLLPYKGANGDIFFSKEERYLCGRGDGEQSKCIAAHPAMDKSKPTPSFYSEAFAYSSSGSVLLNPTTQTSKIVAIVENIKDLGLSFAVNLDISEIEAALLKRLYIALPVIVFFILFFMHMLNWHIMPIFRRAVTVEKDAVESARMLMESESRIRAIIDNIGECIIVFQENGEIESMNLPALQIFQYERNNFESITLSKLLNLEIEDIRNYLNSEANQWMEIKATRCDMTTFDAQIKFKDLVIRHRQLFIAIIRDVTEQKIYEQRLSQSEKVFRNSFDHAPIGMMVLDFKNTINKVNQSLCTMLGYHESELKGRNLKKILPEHLRIDNALPFSKLSEIGMTNFVIESPLLTKSGEIIQTISSLAMFASPNPEDSFFIAQIEDVTLRQRYEEKLKNANQELESRFKELEIHTSVTEQLNQMNGVLQSCLTTSEALTPIEKFAEKLFNNTPGFLYLTSPDSNYMELVAQWGEVTSQGTDVIRKEDCWGLRRGQTYIAIDFENDIPCYHYEMDDSAGFACIPLTAQGELIGLITLYSPNNSFDFHATAFKRLASSFADHVSLSLSNIKLRERLHEQSMHDPLTDLFNRRYFDENMKIELLKAERKDHSLSLLALDIDHFKSFNDTFGHDVGDVVLQEVSSAIRKHIRETDIACRMGGEEFAIIMPGASKAIAFERAEKLREAINTLVIKNLTQTLPPITVSIGIATYPEHSTTVKNLGEKADGALYQAKNAGRNRTIIAENS